MSTRLATADDTRRWGLTLAESLQAGDVVALCGQLGAGKTQATKGIVVGLGSQADVTSPTFTLVHEYTDGRLPVFHFDFYRMEQSGEVLTLGWDEILDEPGVVIVEWADLFRSCCRRTHAGFSSPFSRTAPVKSWNGKVPEAFNLPGLPHVEEEPPAWHRLCSHTAHEKRPSAPRSCRIGGRNLGGHRTVGHAGLAHELRHPGRQRARGSA